MYQPQTKRDIIDTLLDSRVAKKSLIAMALYFVMFKIIISFPGIGDVFAVALAGFLMLAYIFTITKKPKPTQPAQPYYFCSAFRLNRDKPPTPETENDKEPEPESESESKPESEPKPEPEPEPKNKADEEEIDLDKIMITRDKNDSAPQDQNNVQDMISKWRRRDGLE